MIELNVGLTCAAVRFLKGRDGFGKEQACAPHETIAGAGGVAGKNEGNEGDFMHAREIERLQPEGDGPVTKLVCGGHAGCRPFFQELLQCGVIETRKIRALKFHEECRTRGRSG